MNEKERKIPIVEDIIKRLERAKVIIEEDQQNADHLLYYIDQINKEAKGMDHLLGYWR